MRTLQATERFTINAVPSAVLRFRDPMDSIFTMSNLTAATPLIAALLLLIILIVSFRSRAAVFCQYLKAMTGVELSPSDVRRVYRERGRDGVRELFLDLIIKEDLKEGPIEIPGEETVETDERDLAI
jgi:hypothetical protein